MRDRVIAVQSLGRVPVIPCTVDGALLLRKAMAGDFMPRCILLKVAANLMLLHTKLLNLMLLMKLLNLRLLLTQLDAPFTNLMLLPY
jgi:hypothetical protein